MLGTLVDYMHNARIPFRLASYPSEEAQPIAAHPAPPGSVVVDARVFLVDGRPVIVVVPAGQTVDLPAISTGLGGLVVPGTNEALPAEFGRSEGPIPPFGQLFGLPVIADERISLASILVFRAFSESVYFEIPYDDYARLEQPRLASFASAGELAAGGHERISG